MARYIFRTIGNNTPCCIIVIIAYLSLSSACNSDDEPSGRVLKKNMTLSDVPEYVSRLQRSEVVYLIIYIQEQNDLYVRLAMEQDTLRLDLPMVEPMVEYRESAEAHFRKLGMDMYEIIGAGRKVFLVCDLNDEFMRNGEIVASFVEEVLMGKRSVPLMFGYVKTAMWMDGSMDDASD